MNPKIPIHFLSNWKDSEIWFTEEPVVVIYSISEYERSGIYRPMMFDFDGTRFVFAFSLEHLESEKSLIGKAKAILDELFNAGPYALLKVSPSQVAQRAAIEGVWLLNVDLEKMIRERKGSSQGCQNVPFELIQSV